MLSTPFHTSEGPSFVQEVLNVESQSSHGHFQNLQKCNIVHVVADSESESVNDKFKNSKKYTTKYMYMLKQNSK